MLFESLPLFIGLIFGKIVKILPTIPGDFLSVLIKQYECGYGLDIIKLPEPCYPSIAQAQPNPRPILVNILIFLLIVINTDANNFHFLILQIDLFIVLAEFLREGF